MEVTEIIPVHTANLGTNDGNTAYGVDSILHDIKHLRGNVSAIQFNTKGNTSV